MINTKKRRKSKIRRFLEGIPLLVIFWLTMALSIILPTKIFLSISRKFLNITLDSLKRSKKIIPQNLKITFSELNEIDIKLLTEKSLQYLKFCFSEALLHKSIKGKVLSLKYEGLENLTTNNKAPRIFISNHSGNVFMPPLAFFRLKIKINVLINFSQTQLFQKSFNLVYRKFVESYIWKSPQVGFKLDKLLQQKKDILIFTDQNENNGIILPFFNKPARTGTAVPRLAMKYNCPVIPIQTIRTGDQSYIIRFHKPMYPDLALPKEESIVDFLMRVNALYESWICEHPEQYLWLHRRFVKELYYPEKVNEFKDAAS